MLIFKSRINNFRFWKTLYEFGAIKKFHLPDLGEKIKQGTIKKWYVKQGDSVTEFQKIADIASDKQFTELTCIDTGKIHKIFYKEQQICQVGQLLVEIQLPQDSKNVSQQKIQSTKISSNQQAHNNKNQVKSSTEQNVQQKNLFATPAVRHLVKQHKLNIKDIKATGKSGRITKQDVQNHLTHIQQSKKPKPQPIVNAIKSQTNQTKGVKTVQMSNFQKGMQKTMTEANKIPTLYLHEQIDLSELFHFRQKIKKFEKRNITFMSFFIKSFSLSLNHYPILNSLYNPEKPFEYTTYQSHNITIAIDSPNGLAVPNIKNVENLNLIQIQEQINRLRKAAEQAKLLKKDLENGTVCISNIGTVGGTYAGPIIFPPQVAIVAIGKTSRLPRFESDQSEKIVAKRITPISFGCDHRVIDGGTVAKFINKWKGYLQNPELMFLHLK